MPVTTQPTEPGADEPTRASELDRIENAITGLHRIINGRDADRVRMQRAAVSLTLPRMSLLRVLHDRGPMRVVDLGAVNHMDKGYASRAWRSLASEGFIHVVPGEDPRSTTVALTDHGREVYLRWRRANTDIVGEALAGWSDPELVELSTLLERLLASFRQVPAPRRPG
jgi:DNA-binding MarR family transcriptional regulator